MSIMPAAGITTRPAPTFQEDPLDAAMRENFVGALEVADSVMGRLGDMPLPDFFAHPHCHCAPTDEMLETIDRPLQVVEHGYVRWENVDQVSYGITDPDADRWMHAYTDGWDSMSETGAVSYLECCPHRGGCGAIWALPETIDWD